jgi:hypothetical protein
MDKELLSSAFSNAMNDAINIYVRTILKDRGIIDDHQFAKHCDPDIISQQKEITQSMGRAWAEHVLSMIQ